jgi:hypothetical protein
MKIKNTRKYHFIATGVTIIKMIKRNKCYEDVQKLNLLCILGENGDVENNLALQKIKCTVTIDPAIHF